MKIFFSGIGGSGLSGIAGLMALKGHDVHGSDRAFDIGERHPACGPLSEAGIRIVRQDGAALDSSFDLVVFSTAVEDDRPEAVRARELGLEVKTRPGLLAELSASHSTVAVSGTSGKSTTSPPCVAAGVICRAVTPAGARRVATAGHGARQADRRR